MPPEIKKILYATDLSDNARHAYSYAADLADRYGAEITILHVMENISHNANIMVGDILGKEKWNQLKEENRQKLIDKIKSRLENFCQEMEPKLKSCKFTVNNILVKTGVPSEEILKQADTMAADLIVMGSRGTSIVRDALLGSTTHRVLRHCELPVFVIRLPHK